MSPRVHTGNRLRGEAPIQPSVFVKNSLIPLGPCGAATVPRAPWISSYHSWIAAISQCDWTAVSHFFCWSQERAPERFSFITRIYTAVCARMVSETFPWHGDRPLVPRSVIGTNSLLSLSFTDSFKKPWKWMYFIVTQVFPAIKKKMV